MTKIKICGLTQRDDAFLAAELGADALGFVFYEKSKRNISPEQLKWIKQLPAFVQVVGLFVNPAPSLVRLISKQLPIDLLQFHGLEPSSFCQQFNQRYIKAVPMQGKTVNQALTFISQYHQASGFLLDNYGASEIGGSGSAFDWSQIPTIKDNKLIMAGGLHSTNVSEVIRMVQPWAVDVSSGVEESPGIKSAEKMENFIQAVKNKKH